MSLGGDMGTLLNLVLLIIREHPGGITTAELADCIPGNCYSTRRAKAYAAASNLERCGFVEGERVEYKPGNKAYRAVVWRPVE